MPAINGQKPGRYRTGLGPTDDIPCDLIEALPLSVKGSNCCACRDISTIFDMLEVYGMRAGLTRTSNACASTLLKLLQMAAF